MALQHAPTLNQHATAPVGGGVALPASQGYPARRVGASEAPPQPVVATAGGQPFMEAFLPWLPAHAALLAAGQWPVLAPVPHWPALNSWQQYGLPYAVAAAVLLAFAAVGALLWCWCPSLG